MHSNKKKRKLAGYVSYVDQREISWDCRKVGQVLWRVHTLGEREVGFTVTTPRSASLELIYYYYQWEGVIVCNSRGGGSRIVEEDEFRILCQNLFLIRKEEEYVLMAHQLNCLGDFIRILIVNINL